MSQQEYDAACRQIASGLTARVGGTAAENRRSTAYSAMVKAGEVPPIRRKYRVGRALKQVRK